ncbi:MAG: serine/threonine-protein kinase [Polyangiaceae bacterium]
MDCPDDEALLKLLRGRSSGASDLRVGDAMTELDAHLDTCAECRRVVAALAATMESEPPRTVERDETPIPHFEPPPKETTSARVGRYELGRELGRGGMGVVYEARDPQLLRAVAVKVLRPGGGPTAAARMLREAQILARFKHPNVITIHDVGTSLEGEIFLAMELASRGSLRAYLREEGRTYREVCAAFLQAGRGLFAAHERGLVHRDFKPDNVLLGDDGQFRVTDFGLARSGVADSGESDSAETEGARKDPRLTHSGAILGTPAYMAHEQHAGEPVDHRADQFAFAVSVFEAVTGRRPFEGSDPDAVAKAVEAGEVDWTTRRFPVSRALRAALSPSLSPDREARHASLAPLIAALEREASPPRRAYAASAGAVLALGVAASLTLGYRANHTYRFVQATPELGEPPSPLAVFGQTCNLGAAAAREELGGARRDKALTALKAIHQDSAERVLRPVDAWAVDYARLSSAQCEAAIAAEDLGAALSGRKCFERRLRHATALLDALGKVDGPMFYEVATGLATLDNLAECEDPAVRAVEAAIAEDVTDASLGLARAVEDASVRTAFGQGREASVALEQAIARAPEAPIALRAEAELARAEALEVTEHAPALEARQRAIDLAKEGHHTAIVLRAELGRAASIENSDRARARADLEDVLALASDHRAWQNDVALANARLARLARDEEDLPTARAFADRARAALHDPSILVRGEVLAEAAMVGIAERDTARLPALLDELARVWDEALGSSHPHALRARVLQADGLIALGRLEEALPLLEATRLAQERALGLEHPDLIATYRSLAIVLAMRGRRREALEIGELRLPILRKIPRFARERRVEPLHEALLMTAKQALYLEEATTAEAYAREAAEECNQLGSAIRDACERDARATLGTIFLSVGHYQDAADELTRALSIQAKPPLDAVTLGTMQFGRAVAHYQLGNREEAIRAGQAAYAAYPEDHPNREVVRDMLKSMGAAP